MPILQGPSTNHNGQTYDAMPNQKGFQVKNSSKRLDPVEKVMIPMRAVKVQI